MEEVWRNVPGYNGFFVSNLNGFKHNNKILKGHLARGYRMVNLTGYSPKQIGFHILVAKAFPEICGEWFKGCNVHHKDFNKLNNTPENLIVLTPVEHQKIHYQTAPDTFKKPTPKRIQTISKALTGKRAIKKHIPILQLTLNGEAVREWDCVSDVASAGYDISNICKCCRNKLNTAYGFKWYYK